MNTLVIVLAMCGIAVVSGDPNSDTSVLSVTSNADEDTFSLQDRGFDVTGKRSLTFKVKSCDEVILRFFPKHAKPGDTAFKVRLNKHKNGNILAVGRLCSVKNAQKLICDEEETSVEMESTCDDYRTFWVNFDNKRAQLGEGCVIGENELLSGDTDKPFNLGYVRISSKQYGSWVFGNICEDVLSTTESVTPVQITGDPNSDTSVLSVTSNADEDTFSLQDRGFDVTGKRSLTFKVKSCDEVILRFFPKHAKPGDTAFKVRLNKHKNGNILAVGRLCSVKNAQKLICDEEETSVEMESTCDDYRTFWVNFDNKRAQLGEGCVIGKNELLSGDTDKPFNLGYVRISSKQYGSWVFGNICQDVLSTTVQSTQTLDATTLITTENDNDYKSLQSQGFDITGKKSLFFKVKSCDDAIIRFFPDGLKVGDPGYKFRLNRHEGGNLVAVGRLCHVKQNGNFNCKDKIIVDMETTCDAFKTFWIHFDDKGTAEFGEGCDIGKNKMFTIKAESPFHLGEVRLTSDDVASWKYGKVCQVDDTQIQTTTETSKPEPTTTASPKPEPTTTASPKPEPTTTASPKPEPTTTASPKPETTTTTSPKQEPTTTASPKPESTTTASPKPEPTTTASQKPEPTTTASPKPEPTTTASPKPETTTTASPKPEPTTTAASPKPEPTTTASPKPEPTTTATPQPDPNTSNSTKTEAFTVESTTLVEGETSNNNDGSQETSSGGGNDDNAGSNNNDGSNIDVTSNSGSNNNDGSNNNGGSNTGDESTSGSNNNEQGNGENDASNEGSEPAKEDKPTDWSSLLGDFMDNSSPSVGTSPVVLLLTAAATILKLLI